MEISQILQAVPQAVEASTRVKIWFRHFRNVFGARKIGCEANYRMSRSQQSIRPQLD